MPALPDPRVFRERRQGHGTGPGRETQSSEDPLTSARHSPPVLPAPAPACAKPLLCAQRCPPSKSLALGDNTCAHTVHCTRSCPQAHSHTLRAKQDPLSRARVADCLQKLGSVRAHRRSWALRAAWPQTGWRGTSTRRGRGRWTECPRQRR